MFAEGEKAPLRCNLEPAQPDLFRIWPSEPDHPATSLFVPFLLDGRTQISHAHPQILHLGETIHLFQPPQLPGGSWEEMEAVTWAIEQNPDGQVVLGLLTRISPFVARVAREYGEMSKD